MDIETINPLHDPTWEAFASSRPEATVFHSAAWARVLHDTYGFEPRYLAARGDDGAVLAGIPLVRVGRGRLVGLPFSDLCPPLLPEPEAGARLLAAARGARGDGISSLELRGGDGLESQGFHQGAGFLHHEVPLDGGLDAVLARIDSSTRQHTKRARKHGVTVRRGESLADMRTFYTLMVMTRKKHGVLPQPWRFFENVYRHLVVAGAGHLLLAEWEGRVVAGQLWLAYGGTLTEKFSASDPQYLRVRPNHLLFFSGIELGLSLGCRRLDLGRCDADAEGLRWHKRSWGAVESGVSYYYYPEVRRGATVSGAAGVPRRLLALVVRHAPLWALQGAGSAVYRHLA